MMQIFQQRATNRRLFRVGFGAKIMLSVFISLIRASNFAEAQATDNEAPPEWKARVADWNISERRGIFLLSAKPLRQEGLRQSIFLERLVWNDDETGYLSHEPSNLQEFCGATVFQSSRLIDFFDATSDFGYVALRITSLPTSPEGVRGVERLIFAKLDKRNNVLTTLNCP